MSTAIAGNNERTEAKAFTAFHYLGYPIDEYRFVLALTDFVLANPAA
jgi:hypothetical protein